MQKVTRFALWLRNAEGHPPLTFDEQRVTVGRSSTNLIRVLDKSVSRNHLVVEVFEDYITVEDLNSTAGTTINSETAAPFKKYPAREGDSIVIGDCLCELVKVDVEVAGPAVDLGDSDGMKTLVYRD